MKTRFVGLLVVFALAAWSSGSDSYDDAYEVGASGGFDLLGAALLSAFAIPVYLLIGVIVAVFVSRANSSAGAGIFAGLGIGAVLGVVACFAALGLTA